MSEQNYKNHIRLIPVWHYITAPLLLALLIGSIVNLVHADAHTHYSAALIVLIAVILIIIYWYASLFALRAQDRAIRAEENFRHYILTGKPFDKQIRLGQIIALRFASDEEMPALAKRAVEEKLTQKQIKQAIQNWRGDYNRV
jgi:Na+/melibiose symporter-like transporter